MQKETIKELERQLHDLKNHQTKQIIKDENRRDRCVSVQKMERSHSPMINVPRLDLSKVKPYDKSTKPQSQTIVVPPEKHLKTIQYGVSGHNSANQMKYQVSLSPPSVPLSVDNSFTYYAPQGLISSTNNSVLNVSQDRVDLSSEALSRKNGKDTMSVASAGATWSATQSSINGEQRKRSNPPVPKLDLTKLSGPSEPNSRKQKAPVVVDQKSIDAWQVKIERYPQPIGKEDSWRKYAINHMGGSLHQSTIQSKHHH